MNSLLNLITRSIIRGSVYRFVFKGRSNRVILIVAAVACVVYVMGQHR